MSIQMTGGDLMDPVTCERAQVTREDAVTQLVRDVMLHNPKTLRGDATVDDARAMFADTKVVTAVVADGPVFVGLLSRSDLPSLLPGNAPIRTFSRRTVPSITPDRPVAEAVQILDEQGLARLVVLEADGTTLAGLLCLDLKRAGFCGG